MVEGEFNSMTMLHKFAPEMVPKPIGFGTYESNDDIHFFLCEFIDLYDELPDIVDFCKGLADMHLRSMDNSPNGKFGFPVTTCNGTAKAYTEWQSSWEEYFIQTLKQTVNLEEVAQGESTEIREMLPTLYEKVCPRLLRPLETDGHTLRPCLVHGDMWDGNVGTDTKTGQFYIFDAAARWAHNEYELHLWRPARFKFGKPFVKEYFNHFPISPPEDDWEDRNLLYSLIADLQESTLFTQTKKFRTLAIQNMRELVEKHANGYEGSAKKKGDEEVQDVQLATGMNGILSTPNEKPPHSHEHEVAQQGNEHVEESLNHHQTKAEQIQDEVTQGLHTMALQDAETGTLSAPSGEEEKPSVQHSA